MKNTHAVLLVVLVLTPGPGGSPGPALAQHCPADITIPGHDDVAKIASVRTETTTDFLDETLYVNPEPDFKGVTLVVEALGSGGELHEAWFPLGNKCFPDSAVWWKVELYSWVSKSQYHNGKHDLFFQVENGECNYSCAKIVTFRNVRRLLVKGHGTSQWRRTYLHPDCGTLSPKERTSPKSLPSCSAPPSPRTSFPRPDNTSRPTPTPASTTPPITEVVAALYNANPEHRKHRLKNTSVINSLYPRRTWEESPNTRSHETFPTPIVPPHTTKRFIFYRGKLKTRSRIGISTLPGSS
ncbi:hypothetical protein GWK47_018022 [Chionoecetes opilio]|uniref:Uncharacterized protein n=1 Tax=Chionoecetes opilio TaxID=41210 RepID=A0A8J4XRE2_CHIOP|nr:hypothetical protein GWK47_018022 [Chionoecetes opilio]